MKEVQYKDFSLDYHTKLSQFPIVGELELTYACPLHCQYCYTDCYNNPKDIRKQLSTDELKRILTLMREQGCLWLLFTGGDPMARRDFFELYDFAKSKGFIITIFASGLLFTEQAVERLRENPPFNIEVTIMGSNKEVYEKISKVKGSWEKFLKGVERVRRAELPISFKTVVCTLNDTDLENIQALVKSWGKRHKHNATIFSRLDGDNTPGTLRISPEKVIEMKLKEAKTPEARKAFFDREPTSPPSENLFKCAAGFNTFKVDANGKMIFCNSLRVPSYDLRGSDDFQAGFKKMFAEIRDWTYQTDSKCRTCEVTHLCIKCPAKAQLEKGDPEAPIEYFCELAKLTSEKIAAGDQAHS